MPDPHTAGAVILGFLFLVGVLIAVWKIDDHFVTRREFEEAVGGLRRSLEKISEHLGIPTE
jgi:hypothetical protein